MEKFLLKSYISWSCRNTKAANGGVLWKKVLKFSQISQEDTYAGVSF